MGTSAVILKSRSTYSPEKFLSDTIISVFRAKLNLYFPNDARYFDNGSFNYTTLNISDKSLGDKNVKQALVYVKGIDTNNIDKYQEVQFDWVEKGKKLYRVAFVEEVWGIEELAFNFLHEYLKLNPDDYIWFDSYDWVFKLEHMEKLRKLPFDREWCYKNPV